LEEFIMADTHALKEITKYAIGVISKELNSVLKPREIPA
jgi:hypothetical protein